jgi:hypothetical protein
MAELKIVGTEKGGDGKSTVAVLLAEMLHGAGQPHTVVDADDQSRVDHAGGVASRLGELLPDQTVTWIGAGPSSAAIEDDPDKLNAHWDQIGKLARRHDVLVDLGANTLQRLVAYLADEGTRERWKRRRIAVTWFVPFTADDESFAKGLKSLRSVVDAMGDDVRAVAVLNERNGGFEAWHGTDEWRELDELAERGVETTRLPRCRAPHAAWTGIQRERLSAFAAYAMNDLDLAEKLGIDEDVAGRAQDRIGEWINAAYTNFGAFIPENAAGNGQAVHQSA